MDILSDNMDIFPFYIFFFFNLSVIFSFSTLLQISLHFLISPLNLNAEDGKKKYLHIMTRHFRTAAITSMLFSTLECKTTSALYALVNWLSASSMCSGSCIRWGLSLYRLCGKKTNKRFIHNKTREKEKKNCSMVEDGFFFSSHLKNKWWQVCQTTQLQKCSEVTGFVIFCFKAFRIVTFFFLNFCWVLNGGRGELYGSFNDLDQVS